MSENLRQASRRDFRASELPTIDQLQVGALQRIADATETMARNYSALVAERDRYQRWYEQEQVIRAHAERRVASLKGVITRMKAKRIDREA